MGSFNMKCSLTYSDISSGDLCHAFYISEEEPLTVVGYAYGVYGDSGYLDEIKEGFFVDSKKKKDRPDLMLCDAAIEYMKDAEIDGNLEYPISKADVIPQNVFDCLVKTLKIQGFQFIRDYVIIHNSQPREATVAELLNLRELLYIYKKNQESWDYDIGLVCHASGIPLYNQNCFYKISFLRRGQDLTAVRERKYEFVKDEYGYPTEEGRLVSDIFNPRCQFITELDYVDNIDVLPHYEYYSIYMCEDVYNYIRKHSTHPQIINKLLTQRSHFISDSEKKSLNIVFHPADVPPHAFVNDPKTTSFNIFLGNENIRGIYDIDSFCDLSQNRNETLLNAYFYKSLGQLWIASARSGLSCHGNRDSLKFKPKELFKLKCKNLEDAIAKIESNGVEEIEERIFTRSYIARKGDLEI